MVAIVIWRKQTGKQAGIHSIVLFILLKSSIWKYHFICDFNYIKLNENLFHNITYSGKGKRKSFETCDYSKAWRWENFFLKLYDRAAIKLDLLAHVHLIVAAAPAPVV